MSIETIVRRLRLEFILMWVLAGVLALCYETGLFTEGFCTADATAAYILETAVILLTLVTVPVALKISGHFLRRRLRDKEKETALPVLLRWSEVQLFLLAIVILLDVSVYYATMESLGILCAAVGLAASLLCFPGREKLENYLHDSKEKSL